MRAAGPFLPTQEPSPALDGLGGRFYADQKEMQASPDACDPDKAKRFWDLAVELTRAR